MTQQWLVTSQAKPGGGGSKVVVVVAVVVVVVVVVVSAGSHGDDTDATDGVGVMVAEL